MRRVCVQRSACIVVHDACVKLAGLVVLGELALVIVVRLAGDDVVGDGVRGFGDIGTELGEHDIAVGVDVCVATVVGVGTEVAVEVEGRVGGCHEGAVDWRS